MKKTKADAAPQSDTQMTVSGHLKELRNRVLVCVGVLLAGFCLCLAFASRLVNALTELGKAYDYVYVYIAPQELLMVHMNVALVGAAVLTFPVLAYETYAFCSPGLRAQERRFTLLSLVFGTLCFAAGALFARFITLPFMLRFLIQFTGAVDVAASISIESYISFLLTVMVIFGLVFELPIVSVLLTSLGLIRPEWLVKGRKVMIVAIFFLAAVITPPDILSQIMVALPILALYELSIALSRLVGRKKRAARAENE